MRVALFVSCLVDLMRPAVGFAALELLRRTGCEVDYLPQQTCCGQPADSAGDLAAARSIARRHVELFADCDALVVSSGSCAQQIVERYPALLADDSVWQARAQALAAHTHELSSFLAQHLPDDATFPALAARATYHDSCKGLRRLGIKAQPRALLARVPGLQLIEAEAAEECCGFGGAFAVQFGALSTAIVDRKCAAIAETGAELVIGGDLGCLLNIEGRLRRRGDDRTRVLHFAEVLAGNGNV